VRTPVRRRGRAIGSREPAGRHPNSLCSIKPPVTKVFHGGDEKVGGEGLPAAGQAPPLLRPAGGAQSGLLNPLATMAASSTGRRGVRRSRPGAHQGRRRVSTVRGDGVNELGFHSPSPARLILESARHRAPSTVGSSGRPRSRQVRPAVSWADFSSRPSRRFLGLGPI
jgi:hypothetical protein